MQTIEAKHKVFFYLLFIIWWIITPAYSKEKVEFTENKGQWATAIRYKADLDGGALFVEDDCFTYYFYDKNAIHENHLKVNRPLKKIRSHAFKMNFVNANKNILFEQSNKSKEYKNYFIGNDPQYWKGFVYSWGQIIAKNIYSGIDMETHGIKNGIKYQFNIAPNANYKQIKLDFKGIDKIWINKGSLHIKTSLNEIIDQEPIAWQIIHNKKVYITCKYKVQDNIVSFELSNKYKPEYPLYIDPVLVFASYTGSTADNFGLSATYDSHGNLFAGGLVYNVGYPTTTGAFDETYNGAVQYGRTDISISKFDSTGTTLIYSTYLGGANNTEVVHSMVANSNDELCIYGTTGSDDFPVTSGAYNATFKGGNSFQAASNGTFFENGTDCFVTRFNHSGTQLIGSTFMGGSDNDGLNTPANLAYNYGDFFRGEINIDSNDNIIVGSCTYSSDFPTTSNAVQAVKNDALDGCLFKFDATLQNLLYSSFVGGNQDDAIYAIAIDGDNVYITGGTASTNLSGTAGTYQSTFAGGTADGFVAKISTNSNTPIVTSYIGTNVYDQSFFIQLDALKNVYLLGQTTGLFPYIGSVYQNPNSGQFIMKLDSTLSTVFFSTTFGNGNGTTNISPSAFLVDDCEHIYISGWTGNLLMGVPTTGMPLTNNAFQSTTDGFDFYLAVFEQDMDSMIYATYFGGAQSHEHVDGGTSRFDKKGIVYQALCAGCGGHDDFPTTTGAWSTTNNSTNCNVGVFKFDFEIGVVSADFIATPMSGCAPLEVHFTNLSPNNYLWDFGNNDTTSVELNPVRTFTNAGTYPVKLITRDVNSCNQADTVIKYITVQPGLSPSFSYTNAPCTNTVNFSDLSGNMYPSISSWQWNFGDSVTSSLQNPIHTFTQPGTYTVQLSISDNSGCSGTIDTVITLSALEAEPAIVSSCGNNTVQFNAQPNNAGNYLWNFGNTGAPNNTSALQSTTYLYPDTGLYHAYLVVYWGNNNMCSDTAFFDIHINPPFNASFTSHQDSCSNVVSFLETTNVSGNPSVQWQWNFGDGQSSVLQNPDNNFQPGNYIVNLIVTAQNGCVDTVSSNISIKSYPPYSISPDTLLCLVPADILLEARGGDFYYWMPDSAFNNPSTPNQLVTVHENTTYSVIIGRINSQGDTCRQLFSTHITISSVGLAQIAVEAEHDTIFAGESTSVNVSINQGNYTFQWQPAESVDKPNSDNIVVTPPNTTEYTLTVTEGNSCRRTEKVKIVVFKAVCDKTGIYIPNTFSPNNDGNNDVLRVRGNYISQLYFAIYNRWGEKVFETNDKNIGWDGYYQGHLADPGVFGWFLKATCRNGEVFEDKGNVTLIR